MIQVTEEITLSLISESDTQDVFGAINTYRDSLRTWLPFVDGTYSPADTEAFIRFTNEIGEKTFVIRDRKHIFVGLIGLKGIDNVNRKAEIGYWLIPDFEGKGIMSDAIRTLIKYAFEEQDLNRLVIRVAVGNDRSRHIPERLGFEEEGIERDGELLVSGFTDIVSYGLLKKEWNGSN